MDFLLIMGIGSGVAIWIALNLPKSNVPDNAMPDDERDLSRTSPAWAKDSGDVFATGELDYVRKRGRSMDDPAHWPPPLHPLRPPEESNESG